MDELLLRLQVLLTIVVPFVFFMASIYLALYLLFARFIRRSDSPVLWFFGVVTGPLTRPVRAMLPPGTPESRVRTTSLVVYVALWLGTRALFLWLGGPRSG